jgi:2-polyprenyl-6-methoxyphenol hydroxylase-like FAD-dependent oxidoreductase
VASERPSPSGPRPRRRPRVLIAGGGIGGLAAALALHDAGCDVAVYEAAAEIRPLGVGINVLPHAMAALDRHGLVDLLVGRGVATSELRFVNRHGQVIWREPRGRTAGYPVPQVSVHRGTLQLTLLDAVRDRLGPDGVRTGLALRSFATEDGPAGRRVEARFADRSGSGRGDVVERADLLVAADGIHSTARRILHPGEGPPLWNGQLLWRATSRAAPYLDGATMVMAGSNRTKFVAYPITGPDDDGLCTVNWIAELNRSGRPAPAREDWNRRGDVDEFAPWFADWRWDWLDVPGLIASTDAVYEFPMVDRDPLDGWVDGRLVLLGDAAHPMYPVGSNGASQAILDARALAGAVAAGPDLDAALARYEAERLPATAAIVAANRRGGPEQVLDLAEQRAPDGFADVGDVFAPGELEAIAARYKQVAGFPVETVETVDRPSGAR